MGTYDKLLKVQSKLKAPKNSFNSFGKYKYRSLESILESVKPLLEEEGLVLTLSDEIVHIGDRFYVKATAYLYSKDHTFTEQIITNEAYAREELDKKGMDGSQITGAASSYARKYALNGLFLIDDTKDSDSANTGNNNSKTKPKASKKIMDRFKELVLKGDIQTVNKNIGNYELTESQLAELDNLIKKD